MANTKQLDNTTLPRDASYEEIIEQEERIVNNGSDYSIERFSTAVLRVANHVARTDDYTTIGIDETVVGNMSLSKIKEYCVTESASTQFVMMNNGYLSLYVLETPNGRAVLCDGEQDNTVFSSITGVQEAKNLFDVAESREDSSVIYDHLEWA